MNGRQCEHDSGCEGHGFSWSTEHQNSVLCKVHYNQFLKERSKNNARAILSQLTKEDLKSILKEVTA